MADHTQFQVPLPTRHSFGIEIEFLVAWLRPNEKDPYESEAQDLPPILRIKPVGMEGMRLLANRIRKILTDNGIPVVDVTPEASSVQPVPIKPEEALPARLKGKDKWELDWDNSISEKVLKDYRYRGVELKSPAYWSTDEAFEEIKYVVNVLKANVRCRVNPTCGFHVHVGNGRHYFPTTTLRRLGTLLWAADPTLSRLHAPYRSVLEWCPSIRHRSRLACLGATAMGTEDFYEVWMEDYDPLRIPEFSDTSNEEREYGGKERWEEYVRWRKEEGPFMTLNDYIETVPVEDSNDDDTGDDDSAQNEAPEGSGNSISGSSPHLETMDEARRRWDRRFEEYRRRNIPPDMDTLHRNIGWVRWDQINNKKLIEVLHYYCRKLHGHTDLTILTNEQQVDLMIRSQSYILHGHSRREDLEGNKLLGVLKACALFVEAARSSWKWDPNHGRYLYWAQVGNLLEHPKPVHNATTDVPGVVHRMENLAQLTELEGDHTADGIEYVSQQDYEEAIQTNAGLEEMLNSLKDYVPAPDPQFREALVTPVGEPEGNSTTGTGSEPSSTSAYIAAAREAMLEDIEDGSPENVTPPERKFRPHQFTANEYPADYRNQINRYKYIRDDLWERIGWIPSLSHPSDDPSMAEYNNEMKLLKITTTTIGGLCEISACQTGLAVGHLLGGATGRANYNFNGYGEQSLEEDQDADWNSTNPRTIEFREAGGTLDPDWMETWVRICLGLVGFARDALERPFYDLLFTLFEQEERDFRIKELQEKGGDLTDEELVLLSEYEENRVDVLDILFDMGLYREAVWILFKEEYSGPPM
ncbi:putative amidoligase enzyme-domain-containing protein [Hypomontagnella monticulosa]|nr:putative amidoligase enzyme-domain-containing protein [Hypomontagnella monticulosa]